MKEPEEEFFEISAVARLTGISSHVLRVWERRYGVVEPRRSDSRRRRYLREDIQRLTLLKTLVDHGHTIGSIAKLATDQLEERLSQALDAKVTEGSLDAAVPVGICRVAMVGTKIRQAVRGATDSTPALRIVGEFSSLEDLAASLRPGSADLVILEQDTIFPEDIGVIQDFVMAQRFRRAILIYHFATEGTIQPLDIKRLTALRAPVDAAEIQLACIADIELALRSGRKGSEEAAEKVPLASLRPVGEIPTRVFTDEELVRVARVSSVVKCECPQHLAHLLAGLVAFEHYSEQCEDRNQEDAILHAYLHRTTAEARASLEKALSEVLTQEGIQL